MSIVTVETVEELKELFVRILLSRTDKVTKVSEGSVLNGVAYGIAKLSQKSIKDIALAQAHLYPDTAYGQYLDNIANIFGISPRFGALGSTTYLRLVGTPGTVYIAGTHSFSGSNGVTFNLPINSTIGLDGFTYARVQSLTTGSTSVDALTINKVTPIPLGHSYVINEFAAVGGRDIEDDDTFRDRIKNSINLMARGTLAYLQQVFMKINPKVLRVLNYGSNGLGKIRLGVATQDGSDLTNIEITDLYARSAEFLSLSELNPDGIGNIGIEIVNITWESIDISFRGEVFDGYNLDEVRKSIQISMNKLIDYRKFVAGSTIQFVDMIAVIKNTEGMKFVDDENFFMNGIDKDFHTDISKLPRIRGFLFLDSNGALQSNGSGSLNPVFYPAIADFSYQQTVLASII